MTRRAGRAPARSLGRRLLGAVGAGLLCVTLLPATATGPAGAARAGERSSVAKWTTTVFARVPSPGAPAYVHAHTNKRVYAGTYAAPDGQASRVFEWTRDGTLVRSWAVPGQDLAGAHGVQVAAQTRTGRLVVLDTTTSRVLTLDVRTGRWRTVATLPEGSVPNYATWAPGGLYVTDYGDGVVHRVTRRGKVTEWLRDPALDGVLGFGTTGIRYVPDERAFLLTQQTLSTGATLPTNGALLRVPLEGRAPGGVEVVWTSLPTDLPDGFGIGRRTGHVYVAMVGPTNRIAEIDPATGEEVDSFPALPLVGENGSEIPFDSPCNATFLGKDVLVANQSAVQGDASHHAVLRVRVGERGLAPYLPRRATFR
ncbi:SMP-30/gluconolactonase/LRE family protein [uncultured Nocardioides sp.]|uniref:SMP-30/gluconolactonase/LRE family protein n=1 Tax=uncultured Nocardioides sp. TaxID=198441 RepID=UPI000C6805E5|nr:hypothetical protein [uncultured Nocardioides sp.]MAO81864.1 hypothetical protein [Nocardioides sp.]